MKRNQYIILKYERAGTVQKMLGLTDEQFLNVLEGKGYLTTERLSIGPDVLLRVGTYIDEKDAVTKFNLAIPLGIGIGGLYNAIKKRHEYGLNDSENNYFTKTTETELKKYDEDISRRLYLIKTYKEYLSVSSCMNLRIRRNLALNDLYVNNVANNRDIREMFRKEQEDKPVEDMPASY